MGVAQDVKGNGRLDSCRLAGIQQVAVLMGALPSVAAGMGEHQVTVRLVLCDVGEEGEGFVGQRFVVEAMKVNSQNCRSP